MDADMWDTILAMLSYKDLCNFSLTCRGIYDLCKEQRLKSKKRYNALYPGHSLNRPAIPSIRPLIFHKLLYHIWHGIVPENWIWHLIMDEDVFDADGTLYDSYSYNHGAQFKDEADDILEQFSKCEEHLSTSLKQAWWLQSHSQTDVIQEICNGNEDVLCSLLLPMLTELSTIRIPVRFEFCTKIVSHIITNQHPISGQKELSKLIYLEHAVGNGDEYPPSLVSLLPWLALPSLQAARFFSLYSSRDAPLVWPKELPRSCVREIVFESCAMTKLDVNNLAHGLRGPCLLLQTFGLPYHPNHTDRNGYLLEAEWDSAYITASPGDPLEVQFKLSDL